ncbi:MAG: biopolymer transporter ExbD [Treponema sp.]|nr:biopolymer transporter ExbD [Treponema sp.]
MKFPRVKRGAFQESAASSDLAFLLIIYFLVIAAFNVNLGFLVNLPAPDSRRLILPEDLLHFELDSRGDLFYQGEAFSYAQAEGAIRSLGPEGALVLSVDPLAPWQALVSFVELAQGLEVPAFSFRLGGAP